MGKTTTEQRHIIQATDTPVSELAKQWGLSETTVRRWRDRSDTKDRSHAPKTPYSCLDEKKLAVFVFLRKRLCLTIDELAALLGISRASANNYLIRLKLSKLPKVRTAKLRQSDAVYLFMVGKGILAINRKTLWAKTFKISESITPMINEIQSANEFSYLALGTRQYSRPFDLDAIRHFISALP